METEFVHESVMQAILRDRRIGYAITDRDFNVLEVGDPGVGATDLVAGAAGCNLIAETPELVGCETALAEVLAGSLSHFQLPWVNRELADGRLAYLTMTVLPARGPAGDITGLLLVVQDVSEMGHLDQRITQQRNELRLLEEKLRRQNMQLEAQNAELRRLDEAKSAFLSIAAHELRTPLAAIRGYLELLLDQEAGPLTQPQADYLQIVDSSAQRLLRLSNQLLDSTRLEMGRLDLTLQRTDLAVILRDAIRELAPHFAAKAQHVRAQIAADLPACLCDAVRAAQVVSNLLDNASKYSSPASTLTATLRRANEDGFVQLAVHDEGSGIAAEAADSLFTPFYRGPAARQGAAPGAGLGLYIARSLVELHGGRLWFESVPGAGSTFYATFLVADPPSAA